ncbi:MAG: NAD-binding protein [Candidatus Methanoperedens sp.]|nr:NAD-binding protein [Candidatus Methanoperedens sp.]
MDKDRKTSVWTRRLHDAIPYLIQTFGIYVLFLGIVSAIVGRTLLHFEDPVSIFVGIFMIQTGNGLKSRTRISWYLTLFLISASFFAMYTRGFRRLYFDIIGISFNILVLYLLLKYRKEYIFPSRLNLPVEGRVALAAILIAVIYGVAGTMLLGEDFNPPVRDVDTAIYYAFSVLTTLGLGDILPVTNASRLFTMSVAILGIVSFLGGMTTFLEYAAERRIQEVTNVMAKMEFVGLGDHIIVCGYTVLISHLLKSLKSLNMPIVVIVQDKEVSKTLENEGYIVFHEEADNIDVLLRAGLKKAKYVYLCSNDDAYNLMTALTIQKFKRHDGLNCKVTTFVKSSKNSEKFEDFCDEIIDISEVLSDYMLKSKGLANRCR